MKVMIFGTFDGIHEGHRFVFREARKLGDRTIAILARDRTVQKVKGRFPLRDEQLRKQDLEKELGIDEVVLGSLGNKYDVIERIRPDIICLGYDQQTFADRLGQELQKRGLHSTRIVRLKALRPEIYKSSKLRLNETQREKEKVRKKMKESRNRLSKTKALNASRLIAENLFSLPEVAEARSVCIFHSHGNEIQTTDIMQTLLDAEISVLVPKLVDDITFAPQKITHRTKFEENRFGILEPVGAHQWTDRIDVCIVPCLAVDKTGIRIGYGKGYYDRYLSKGICNVSIAVAYDFQLVESLPKEEHDVAVDIVATDKQILRTHIL